jgi:hypothetical protein
MPDPTVLRIGLDSPIGPDPPGSMTTPDPPGLITGPKVPPPRPKPKPKQKAKQPTADQNPDPDVQSGREKRIPKRKTDIYLAAEDKLAAQKAQKEDAGAKRQRKR